MGEGLIFLIVTILTVIRQYFLLKINLSTYISYFHQRFVLVLPDPWFSGWQYVTFYEIIIKSERVKEITTKDLRTLLLPS